MNKNLLRWFGCVTTTNEDIQSGCEFEAKVNRTASEVACNTTICAYWPQQNSRR